MHVLLVVSNIFSGVRVAVLVDHGDYVAAGSPPFNGGPYVGEVVYRFPEFVGT